MASEAPRLLWNPENVKDVAESVGIGTMGDEALKVLTQDVEYRVGQVIIEALRLMRAARRTTLSVNDVALALRVLDVEPLYGYDSTRPLRYGEASLGPGQPLFFIEDEEVDFEKLINAPLPKVPRDMTFTGTPHSLTAPSVYAQRLRGKRMLTDPSTLACHRGRSAIYSTEPHDGRVEIARTDAQGSRREPCPFCPVREPKRGYEAVRQAYRQQGAGPVL